MKKRLLFAFFIFSRLLSFAQWSDDAGVNTPVNVTAGNQYVYNTISDGAGGIISVWGDDVASNGTTVFKNALYAQKLSTLGVKQWGANGVKISDSENNGVFAFSVSDGSGGAIITWVENIGDVDSTANVYAQRLDANGNRLWGNNGVVVCNSPQEQFASNMVSDGAGGVIIVWVDERNVSETTKQIFVQRLNSSGVAQWTTNGILISDTDGDFSGAFVSPDGSGGYTVVWYEDLADGQLEGSRSYWQKITASGARQSPSNTLLFDFQPAATVTEIAGVALDGSGGFYVAITTDDDVTAKLYLQHLLSNGTKAFNATPLGIEVDPSIGKVFGIPGFSFLNYQVHMQSDNAGGAIIAWTDTRSDQDGYFTQRFNSSGTKLWNASDVTVVPESIYNLGASGIVINQAGDFVFLVSKEGTAGSSLLYVQKINTSGAIQYAAGGNAVSTVQSTKFGTMVATGDKVVVAWSDSRNLMQTGYDVYAQSVLANGVLPVRFIDFSANYSNQKTKLSWTTAIETNNDRFEIERSNDGKTFSSIGTVKGAGTVTQVNNYTFSDTEAFSESGYLYYRIKQVDLDGKFDYSETRSVKVPMLASTAIAYYPNPVKDKLTVELNKASGSLLSYSLTDVSGRLILNKTETSSSDLLHINMESIPSGVYILSIKSGDKTYKETIIKN